MRMLLQIKIFIMIPLKYGCCVSANCSTESYFYNGLLLLLLCGLSFNRIEMQGEKQQTVIGLLLRCQSTVALSQIHIEKFGHMSEQNNLISKHILRNICCNCKKWSKENVFLLVS